MTTVDCFSENRSHKMSLSPASPRTPSRFSAGFFTGRRRRQSTPADGARPTSTISYLSADFDATDVSSVLH